MTSRWWSAIKAGREFPHEILYGAAERRMLRRLGIDTNRPLTLRDLRVICPKGVDSRRLAPGVFVERVMRYRLARGGSLEGHYIPRTPRLRGLSRALTADGELAAMLHPDGSIMTFPYGSTVGNQVRACAMVGVAPAPLLLKGARRMTLSLPPPDMPEMRLRTAWLRMTKRERLRARLMGQATPKPIPSMLEDPSVVPYRRT